MGERTSIRESELKLGVNSVVRNGSEVISAISRTIRGASDDINAAVNERTAGTTDAIASSNSERLWRYKQHEQRISSRRVLLSYRETLT